jgi:TRAP-type C4-dicarboxylate transport system substrate-binding protein
MERRRAATALLPIVLSVLAAAAAPSLASAATTTLKFATLLPQSSPWGRELKKWAALVLADTGGDLDIEFQWNGQAGDEPLMVEKIRAGQIDGAVVSAAGLSATGVVDVLMFQLPGLFTDKAKLDAVVTEVTPELEKQFEARGFVVLGWGGAGAIVPMSVGYEVHHPQDLRGRATFVPAGDPVLPVFFSAIGGSMPRTIPLTEVLPGLTSHAISFVAVSPLLAEQLQWSSQITHVGLEPIGFAVGGFLASGPRMLALPQGFKDVMRARGEALQGRLEPIVRNLDAQAYARMKANKVVYDWTDAEKAEWRELFDRVAAQLRGSVFTPPFFDRVMRLAKAK